MNMYNNQGQNIGMKSRKDNHISMSFATPKPQTNSIIQSVAKPQYQASPNFPNGMKSPATSLKTGQENTKDIGNFLQYQASRRNADRMMNYDKMNQNQYNQNANRTMNDNHFIKTLANTKYNQGQNRLQRESHFNKTMDNSNQHFNKTYDLDMQKYQHPISSTDNTQKYVMERTKAFSKNPTSFIPDWDNLDSNQKNLVMQQYINKGTIPKIDETQNFFSSNEYQIAQAPVSQQNHINKDSSKEEADFLAWKKLREN